MRHIAWLSCIGCARSTEQEVRLVWDVTGQMADVEQDRYKAAVQGYRVAAA